jgi:hypothetical protein
MTSPEARRRVDALIDEIAGQVAVGNTADMTWLP